MTNHDQIVEISKTILKDCSLDNGGIVAANSSKDYFPAAAKNYYYVWPRDAAFACLAADLYGMHEIPQRFFSWCINRAEGFRETGLFYEKYHPNGLKALSRFQPDQTGSLILAVYHHLMKHPPSTGEKLYPEIINKAAEGLCKVWDEDHFTLVSNDLWEERLCFPDLKETFTYSLASCIGGLRAADELLPSTKWRNVARQMKDRLDMHFEGHFIRSYGKLPDRRIDASVLGLVYPFGVYDANDERIRATIGELEQKLNFNGGIHRYEHDEYDGWMIDGHHRKKGAGAWPLLNFWLAIYFLKSGNKEKASRYFNWVLNKTSHTQFLPEQVFENSLQQSVSPLLWSHVMYLLASESFHRHW